MPKINNRCNTVLRRLTEAWHSFFAAHHACHLVLYPYINTSRGKLPTRDEKDPFGQQSIIPVVSLGRDSCMASMAKGRKMIVRSCCHPSSIILYHTQNTPNHVRPIETPKPTQRTRRGKPQCRSIGAGFQHAANALLQSRPWHQTSTYGEKDA